MKDPWCKSIVTKNGNKVSGGAARNIRIAAANGMQAILESVAKDAAAKALEQVNSKVSKPNLQLVKKRKTA